MSRSRYDSFIRSQSGKWFARDSCQRSEEMPKCVACWCDNCKKRRDKIDNVVVNLIYDYLVVNLCDNYTVENRQGGEKVMIFDPEAPMSLAGRPWLVIIIIIIIANIYDFLI